MKLIRGCHFTDSHLLCCAQFKYLRVLGAFYLRMVGSPKDIYTYLEPLLNDYRKIAYRSMKGWELRHVDDFVESLLHDELCCDVSLPHLPKRHLLEESGSLPPRVSKLENELDEDTDDGQDGTANPEISNGSEKSQLSASADAFLHNIITRKEAPKDDSEGDMSCEYDRTSGRNSDMKGGEKNAGSNVGQGYNDDREQAKSSDSTKRKRDACRYSNSRSRSKEGDKNRYIRESSRRSRDRDRRSRHHRSSRSRSRSYSSDRRSSGERRSRKRSRNRDEDRSKNRYRSRSRSYSSDRSRSVERSSRHRRRSGERGKKRDKAYHRSDRRDRRHHHGRSDRRESYKRHRHSYSRSRSRSWSRSKSPKKSSSAVKRRSPSRRNEDDVGGKEVFSSDTILDRNIPGQYNQSMMLRDQSSGNVHDSGEFERNTSDEVILDNTKSTKPKRSSKTFDKMFGKKKKKAEESQPSAVKFEEGSVEYWNQIREKIGLKKLRE